MTIFLPDDPSEVCLVLVVIVEPLGVHDVVHRRHPLPLVLDARAHAPQLLHLPAAPKHQAKVHAHRPVVGLNQSSLVDLGLSMEHLCQSFQMQVKLKFDKNMQDKFPM